MCNFIIHSLYSNIEYDIIIGIIIKKIGDSSNIKVGDTVLFFPDNIYTYYCIDDPFMSYYIDEKYIFKISPFYISYILPILKYNCVSYIIKLYISSISKIILYSNYNVNYIISKLIPNTIEWHPIKEFDISNINNDKNVIYITPLLWTFYINNKIIKYDLSIYNILYIIGIENIKFIINSCLKKIKNIKIFINLISFSDITNNLSIIDEKNNYFFNIIKFEDQFKIS